MKKTVLIIYILSGINLFATDKAECEELFKSAIANFYLENTCKFNKHLSSSIRKEFEKKNCTKQFTDNDMKKLNSEVLGNSYKTMNSIGRDKFCKDTKIKYDALVKTYIKKVPNN